MASSITGNDPSSQPCPGNGPPAKPSPLRKKILEESIAANREQTESKRVSAWTKRPKYEKFQSTLDLNNSLEPLPFSKTRKVLPPSFSLCDDFDKSSKDKKRPSSTGPDDAFQHMKTDDMPEMDQMMESSPNPFGASDDPMMLELEEIIKASRSTPILPPQFDSRYPGLLLQPETRPISQEQLASEVKGTCPGS